MVSGDLLDEPTRIGRVELDSQVQRDRGRGPNLSSNPFRRVQPMLKEGRGRWMMDGLMDIQGLQRLGANRRVSKQKLVEVSETVGWRGTHSLTAQVGGDKTGRMEDPAQQTE